MSKFLKDAPDLDNLQVPWYNDGSFKNWFTRSKLPVHQMNLVYKGWRLKNLENYYYDNQDELHRMWDIHVSEGEWGSGEDKIVLTDDMFWEFVEDIYEETKNE